MADILSAEATEVGSVSDFNFSFTVEDFNSTVWRSHLLVEAIIQIESAGNARLVGASGERGLMQLKPATWRQICPLIYGRVISFDLAFDSGINRCVGAAYLAWLREFLLRYRAEWRSDERSLLLACYNAGPERVKAASFDLRYCPRSTRDYVERASALHDYYVARRVPLSVLAMADSE